MSADNNSVTTSSNTESQPIENEQNSTSYSYTHSEEMKLHDYMHELGQKNMVSKGFDPSMPDNKNIDQANASWNQTKYQFPNDLTTVPAEFYQRPDMQGSPILQDKEELIHFREVNAAFLNYKIDSLRDIARVERDFNSIDKRFLEYLSGDYAEKIEKCKKAIDQNHKFCDLVIDQYKDMFPTKTLQTGETIYGPFWVANKDISKTRSTMRQLVRDWSAEGKAERDACYIPLINEVKRCYPNPSPENMVRVLCPGSGLGRLPFDLATHGYSAQGNEFSYYMLLVSNVILNETPHKEMYEVLPYIHNFSNNLTADQPFKKFKIPDVEPTKMIPKWVEFSMAAGEFINVYKDEVEQWDAIATCFFVDTANNIIEYIEIIYSILKPGGIWTNLGPLLYHYSEMAHECSIELSYDELLHVIKKFGFVIEFEDDMDCTYCSDIESMMKTVYKCKQFTARKPMKK